MRDTHRRYRAIAQCLLHLYPHAHGHQRRHLATLVRLITGIVGSQHTQLPNVVEQTPGGHAADECGAMRFRRWLKHNDVTSTRWMPPAVHARMAMLTGRTRRWTPVSGGPRAHGHAGPSAADLRDRWQYGWTRIHGFADQRVVSAPRAPDHLGGGGRSHGPSAAAPTVRAAGATGPVRSGGCRRDHPGGWRI